MGCLYDMKIYHCAVTTAWSWSLDWPRLNYSGAAEVNIDQSY